MAASLIEQLEADALNRSVPITDLLRKTKVAAVKLKRPDLAEWVDRELSGYSDRAEIPPYRRLRAELKFFNPMRGWCPIIGPGRDQPTGQPIGEIAAMLDGEASGFVSTVPPKSTA
jgi:hypothetical protein